MTAPTAPVDGWIVYTSEPPLFWLVKGYEHPWDGVVAVPYRLAWGSRLEPSSYLSAAPPWSLRLLPCIGRLAPVVPWGMVAAVLDPSAALKLHGLPPELGELLEHVGAEWAGLTGSRLTGHWGPGSDYDLLVLPSDPLGAVEALRGLAGEGLISGCPGMRGSLVDACYRGVPYTLRLLRTLSPRGCEGFTASLGLWRGLVELGDAGHEAYLVPARYPLRIPGVGEAVLETWRTRYQGLRPGCYEASLELFEREGMVVASPDIAGGLRRVGDQCGPTAPPG